MSGWTDPVQWEAQRSGADCPVCRSKSDAVAQLETSWVLIGPEDPVRGYACLVFARHAVELHDLNEAEAAAFMRDMRRVSAAAAAITNPVKMNYEVHGNTAPHLHVHFFPRYQGDQFEGGPINPRIAKRPAYAPGEFEQFRERLQTALVLPNTGLKLSAPAPKESGGRPEMGCCTIPFVNVLIRRRSLSAIR